MTAASVGFQCPECVREGARSVRRPSAARTTAYWARNFGVVTVGLIAINVVMYVVTAVTAHSLTNNSASPVFFDLALYGPFVDAGQYWRLLTAAFLHFGPTHLAVNMLSLYIIGNSIEQSLGKVRYGALYLLSGLGASGAAYLLTPYSLVAGASGAVFGLLGGAAVLMVRNKANLRPLISILVLNIVISLLPGISLSAHVGGFITGAAVTYLLLITRKPSRRS